MYRVPHCSNCERCKSITGAVGYTEYYCFKDSNPNVYGEVVANLGVDHTPKKSPKWYPLRKKVTE